MIFETYQTLQHVIFCQNQIEDMLKTELSDGNIKALVLTRVLLAREHKKISTALSKSIQREVEKKTFDCVKKETMESVRK